MKKPEIMRDRRRISLILVLFIVLSAMFCLKDRVEAQGENDATSIDNGIPVLYLNIDESRGTVEAMNESADHSVYCYGTLSITVPEGFRYADFPDTELNSLNDLEMNIRGRGNSTWKMSNKKPYKIKLTDGTDVLGLGTNKHWVLVANDFDATLMKDRITAWLGDEMGFAFTPRGVPVDVVMTGEFFGSHYLGSYYLSENVRVDENRLDIKELKEKNTDPYIITGGYLLQNAMQVRDGSPDRFYTSRGVDWATHTPSFDVEADSLSAYPEDGETGFVGRELGDGYVNHDQQEYIQNYIQEAEDILFDGTTAYREIFDVDTAAKYWLVNIISLNNDAYSTGSTYIYKDRDPEDGGVSKLYWGPLWDFDFAWTRNKIYTGFNAGHKWNKPMFYDKKEGGFLEAVYRYWPKMRTALEKMIEAGGLIDKYAQETRASALADHEALDPSHAFEFDEAVEELKTWIRNRIDWVNENFYLLDDLVHRVTFMADGEVFAYDFMEEADYVNGKEAYPEKDGYTFMGWMDEDGNIIDSQINVTRDMVLTAKYVPDDSLSHATDIAFSKASDVIRNSMFMKTYQIPYVVIPEDAEDKRVKWTSSDSNLASVDEDGFVRYNGPCEVTFTAQLRHGTTRTFTLTVLEMSDDPYPFPVSIYPEQERISLQVGEQSPFTIKTDPEVSKIRDYEYRSDDPEIVTVDENGVLTAAGPGSTKVHVRIRAHDENEEDFYLETYVTVVVSKTEPEPVPKPDYKIPPTGIE